MLLRCLRSLRGATQLGAEVVLVNNGSSDDLRDLPDIFPGIRIVDSAKNLGFAGGNNLGLQHCTAEKVLLLNDDTEVNPEFLSALQQYLDLHVEVGVVQGKMVLPSYGGTLDACGSYLTWLGLPYHYGYFKPDGPLYEVPRAVFSAKGACLMFRRKAVEAAGGFLFQDDFFCYYEESDFCHRVWLSGLEVHFVPTKPIKHLMGGTSATNTQKSFVLRHYLRNMTFSLMGNLSLGSCCTILPCYIGVHTASLALSLLTRRWPSAMAHWEALTWPLRKWRAICERRRLVRRIRRVSDRMISRKVMRNPSLDYFAKTFTGKLADYQDRAV